MFDVANEIAEHDQRKRNIIVYNLPEQVNQAADKLNHLLKFVSQLMIVI